MWVENEKRELKTSFKNVTAELKQLLGEINETGKTPSLVEEMSEDGFSAELKSSHAVSSHATESSNSLESKGEFGDIKLMLGGKVPKMETVIRVLVSFLIKITEMQTWKIPGVQVKEIAQIISMIQRCL